MCLHFRSGLYTDTQKKTGKGNTLNFIPSLFYDTTAAAVAAVADKTDSYSFIKGSIGIRNDTFQTKGISLRHVVHKILGSEF